MFTLYEPLGLEEGHKLLELGLGSGYSVVVAREIVGDDGLVVCIEIDPLCYENGKKFIDDSGYKDIILIKADGGFGYPDMAPYDRICITAACTEVPPPLFEQLRTGGKLIAPVIKEGMQKIILFEKGEKGITSTLANEVLYNIPYTPLTGSYGTSDK